MEKNSLIQALNWRYATKVFDVNKKLSSEQVSLIKEALRLSPSSFGLQGWKFLHIVDAEKRQLLRQAAYDQSQVTDASDLFVLAVPTKYGMPEVDHYIEKTAAVRGMKVEDLASFRGMMQGYLSSKSSEATTEWLKRQVYIAIGVAMTVCAANQIDSCPMEGFDNQKVDEILGLKELGLTSVLMLPVGFRSPDDKYQGLLKVRFDTSEVVLEV